MSSNCVNPIPLDYTCNKLRARDSFDADSGCYSNVSSNKSDRSINYSEVENDCGNFSDRVGIHNKSPTKSDSGIGSSNNSSSDDNDMRDNNRNKVKNKKRKYSSDSESDDMSDEENGKNGKEVKKRNPMCARCQHHGVKVGVKGHKRKCPFKDCTCSLCILTIKRRKLMAETIAEKRRQKEDSQDPNYIPPPPVFRKETDKSSNEIEEIEIEDNEETSEKICAVKKPQIIAKAYSALTIESAATELFTVLRNKNNSKLNFVSIQDILNGIQIRNTEVNEVFTILLRAFQNKMISKECSSSQKRPTGLTRSDTSAFATPKPIQTRSENHQMPYPKYVPLATPQISNSAHYSPSLVGDNINADPNQMFRFQSYPDLNNFQKQILLMDNRMAFPTYYQKPEDFHQFITNCHTNSIPHGIQEFTHRTYDSDRNLNISSKINPNKSSHNWSGLKPREIMSSKNRSQYEN